MLEFQQKRRIRKIMYSPVVLVILAFVAFIFVRAAWNVHLKEAESQTYLEQAQAQLGNLSAQQATLQQSVNALNTPQGKEAEIRSQYLMVKPGEQVAVIVDTASATNTATTTPNSGFWAKVAGFFHL